MSIHKGLYWLADPVDWRVHLHALSNAPASWDRAVALANQRLDFIQTNSLDSVTRRVFGTDRPKDCIAKPVRLAVLGSCTLTHLLPAIRVAGMRRGLWIDVFEGDYGQYWQELDQGESLRDFAPSTVLVALDAYHLAAGITARMEKADADLARQQVVDRIRTCWQLARDAFRCKVIHQMPLPVHPAVLGSNEHRLPGSRQRFIQHLSEDLRRIADVEAVDLLALDVRAAQDGISAWHDPSLWHKAKQEISPLAAPLYGDLVGRLLAAQQGRVSKCLILDLDNTVWGGVVGDDGVEGLVIGQGSGLGEAFVSFQDYVRELTHRGVVLAVCSKNDEPNALEPFDRHPEMVLQRSDIACFVANWSDKPANIRAIAEQLNLGLDALVFVDDNPFERTLVRNELPMVGVPEVADDPAFFAQILADAGFFESVAVTTDDRSRTLQYQADQQRESLKASAGDFSSYLHSLNMRLYCRRFDRTGLQRIVQLINKTNQFNLTARHYNEEDVLAVMEDSCAIGLQLRLVDRFGDNGIIGIVIGRLNDAELWIDTWLMSCRVLGRQVEPATLNLVVEEARRLGASRIAGEYRPTKKNRMVKDHYFRLGFADLGVDKSGSSRSVLDLAGFAGMPTFIAIERTQ